MKKKIDPKLQAILDMNKAIDQDNSAKSSKKDEFRQQMKADDISLEDDYIGHLMGDINHPDDSMDSYDYDDMELEDYYLY